MAAVRMNYKITSPYWYVPFMILDCQNPEKQPRVFGCVLSSAV